MIYLNSKNKNGFTVMTALGMGLVLASAAIGIIQMKRSIDNETKNTAIKHARSLAEDIIKTQVAIQQKEMTQRADFLNFVRSFVADPAAVGTGFQVPIPVRCGATEDDLCKVKILSVYDGSISSDTNPNPISDMSTIDTMTSLRLSIGLSDEDNAKLKMKISPIDITIKLPSQSEFDNPEDEFASDLVCPLQKPIFRGTLPGPDGQLIADCQPVGSSATAAAGAVHFDITCDVAAGMWLTKIDDSLNPSCTTFPNESRAPASVLNLCSNDQIAKYYELGASTASGSEQKFTIQKINCVDKGSPYQFMQENKSWAP
ncbi:MAG: hypothetical protein R3A80_02765 [Bdellovibrionota bacterium]